MGRLPAPPHRGVIGRLLSRLRGPRAGAGSPGPVLVGGGGRLEDDRLFREAPAALAVLDARLRIVTCNRAFGELCRQDGSGMIGRSLADLVRSDSADFLAAAFGMTNDRPGPDTRPDVRHGEITLAGETGVACQVLFRRLDGGPPGAWIVQLLDLTERKTLEQQFAQSQKMQAVGQLAGGVAHDFNNLLTAMIGFCDLLLIRHRPGDQSFAEIMQIKQNANRAANLVRQLLAFSRQQTLQPRVLVLTDVLADTAHLLRRLLGEGVELDLAQARDLWPVRADVSHVEQVLINLAVNARDAMPGGGRLEMRTANRTFEKPTRIGDDVLPAGDYVTLTVADTGQGIPPEHLARIFDPFFTTKEVGQGTGLGLSTAYGIMKQTGGTIAVDSEPGAGAVFTLFFPRSLEAPEEPKAAPPGQARDLTGSATILVVEDDAAVRTFSCRALRKKGYQVLEAASGDAALALLETPEAVGLELLITDVVMPRLDGPTLAARLRERIPDLRVLFISGYAEDALRDRLIAGDSQFLPKPYDLRELVDKVKTVLG